MDPSFDIDISQTALLSPMATTAVFYQSSIGGNTRTVAEYIAKELSADVFDLKNQSDFELGGFDRIIIGTGVHAGNPYKKVTNFVNVYKEELAEKKVYLFISCMYKNDKGANQASRIADEYRIPDVTFFPTGGAKDESGVLVEVKAFVERMKK